MLHVRIRKCIIVREQNFGRPSTICQNRTSSNKGSLRGLVRCAGVLNQQSGTSLNTNTGSIGAPRAHLRPHVHKATLARTPSQWSGTLARTPSQWSGNLKLPNTFLMETLIKYQRRSWPLFDFLHANKLFVIY
jgi:hypothetical protein